MCLEVQIPIKIDEQIESPKFFIFDPSKARAKSNCF